MKKGIKKIRINVVYKRFAVSFMIALFIPVIFFIYIYMQNYRELYRSKIVEQAQSNLNSAGMELERNIDSLNNIVTTNTLKYNGTHFDLYKDYLNSGIKDDLLVELVTRNLLDKIFYYNEVRPDIVFSNNGTYTIPFFAQRYTEMESFELLEQLSSMEKAKLELWKDNIHYIVPNKYGERWIFMISDHSLKQIIQAKNSVTVFLDSDQNELYSTDSRKEGDYYEITFHSTNNYFSLVRYIEKDSLFAEINQQQRYFFIFVIFILFAGGILTLVLTYYNEYPVKKLLKYSREKVRNIPEDMNGLEAFEFAIRYLGDQVALSESRRRKNRLLLHMIYGKDCDEEYFCNAMKEESMFEGAEYYRVILVTSEEAYDNTLEKIELYLNLLRNKKYEFRWIDLPSKEAVVMIAGMTESAEMELEQELRRLHDTIADSINEKICFYVGDKCTERNKIHLSYSQALSCRHNTDPKKKKWIVYYQPPKRSSSKVSYPREELDALYDSLISAESENISNLTKKLIDILKTYSDNRFASITLYYDILNAYYRAQAKMEIDMESAFLENDLLEMQDHLDSIQMILRIQEQYQSYLDEINGKTDAFVKEDGRNSKEDLITRVIAFIDENYRSSDLCVSMVADYFGMSISYMSQKFKKQTNRTLLDYITEKKFSYARELLLETDYSIKVVSFMLGYNQPFSFIRKFKQEYGMTPMEYRTEKGKIEGEAGGDDPE